MVAADGHVYQVIGERSVRELESRIRTSFAPVTCFRLDSTDRFAAGERVTAMERSLNRQRTSNNLLYAITIGGRFSRTRARMVRPAAELNLLAKVTADQREFAPQDPCGTLVSFPRVKLS